MIVVTKADLVTDPQPYVDAARTVSARVSVVAPDAKGDEATTKLSEWCRPGRTVAFLGSSGVGKSALTNALSGAQEIVTHAVREVDAKGHHTTTRRELHAVPGGCLFLDTPGMRELQLTNAASGIARVFEDIAVLSLQCRFGDYRHETEPCCAERRRMERAVGKMVRRVMKEKSAPPAVTATRVGTADGAHARLPFHAVERRHGDQPVLSSGRSSCTPYEWP